jgi:small subunit ribosomal protein S5
VESAGVRDVLTKTLGTNTPHNVVRATVTALRDLHDPEHRLQELGRA